MGAPECVGARGEEQVGWQRCGCGAVAGSRGEAEFRETPRWGTNLVGRGGEILGAGFQVGESSGAAARGVRRGWKPQVKGGVGTGVTPRVGKLHSPRSVA